MELKVQRDTRITIGLSEEEASKLLSLLDMPSRGVLPIADELHDALVNEDVRYNIGASDALHAHFNEVFNEA